MKLSGLPERFLPGVFVSFVLMSPAWALEAGFGLGYAAAFSDNIGRVPDDERSEWINVFRGSLGMQEVSTRFDARFFSQLEFRQYARETFEDEALLALDGIGTWVILPGRASFTVEDRFTQVAVDPTFVVNPANRQDTNVLSFGPNFFFRATRVDDVEIGGRYTNTYYEVADTDSDRYSGYGRILHQVSPITRVSLNYEPSYVEYRETALNIDYLRQDAFLGLSMERVVMDMGFDVGKIHIARDGMRDLEGTLVRARLSRRMTSDSSIEVFASDEYSEAARDRLISDPLIQTPPSPATVNPADFVGGGLYAVRHVDAAYVKRRYYGDSRVNVFWRRLDFESPQLLEDQRVYGAFADIGYDLTGAKTLAIFGNLSETSFLNVPREDRDYGIGGRFIYRFLKTLSFMVEARWSGRDSTLAIVEYDERRVVFTVAYNTNYALAARSPIANLNDPLYR